MRFASMALVTATVGGLLSLVACNVEYGLDPGQGNDPDSIGPGGNNGGDDPGGGGNNGGGGPDDPQGSGRIPWGDLDPSALPDVYFALAIGTDGYWNDWLYCDTDYDCDGLWDCGCGYWPEDPYGGGGYWGGSVEYVVVDLRGHVIEEFVPPDSHFAQGNVQHLDLKAAGPGQFLAVTWLPEIDTDPTNGETGDDSDSDGLYEAGTPNPGGFSTWDPHNRYLAWTGDAVTHSSTRLVKGQPDPYVWYDGTARVLPTGIDLELRGNWEPRLHFDIAPDQPDRLMAWSGTRWCTGTEDLRRPDRLKVVDLTDGTGVPESWSPYSLMPAWLMHDPGSQTWPFDMETAIDEQGVASAMFGVGVQSCYATEPSHHWIGAWDPATGDRLWERELPAALFPEDVSYSAFSGGGAVHVAAPVQAGWPQVWTMWTPTGETSGVMDQRWQNWRVGPMLDPAGPSFVGIGTDPDTGFDSLVVNHGGNTVWKVKKLKYGLEERGVHILDAVMLMPPE